MELGTNETEYVREGTEAMDFNFEMTFCIPSTQIVPNSNVLRFRVPLYVFLSIYMGYLKMSKNKAWPRCGGNKTLGKHERG